MLSQSIIHDSDEVIWCPTLSNTLLCSAVFLRQVELRWSWSHRDKGAMSLKISGVALKCTTRHLPTVCAVMCWTCNIWKTHVVDLLAHRLTRLNSLGFALTGEADLSLLVPVMMITSCIGNVGQASLLP